MKNIPLGEPGLGPGGEPIKPFDQTSRTRRAFTYQDYAAYALILKAATDSSYTELWLEHHDDILAVRTDGRYDIFQVKTKDVADSFWEIGDKPIYEAIKKFCEIERSHDGKITTYSIYSNLRPYVPADTAGEKRKATSYISLAHKLEVNSQLSPEDEKSVLELMKQTSADEALLGAVLKKLKFVLGPPLDSFRKEFPTALCDIEPKLVNWPVMEIRKLEGELLERVLSSSSADVPPLVLHTSAISKGGIPSAELPFRRITSAEVKSNVRKRVSQRKRNRFLMACGVIGVSAAIGGFIFRQVFPPSALQHAIDVIQSSAYGASPAELKESVAIVRAAEKPLEHINLTGANLECVNMSELQMPRASGHRMHASGVIFDDAVLAGAYFSESELNGSSFKGARMDSILLTKSNMLSSNFSVAEARNAQFDGVTMNSAVLIGGVFNGSNFSDANLDSADLNGADFSSTDLKGANLNNADISGVKFIGAKNLTQEMLASACLSDDTKPPLLDGPLKAPERKCYTTPKEKEMREVTRMITSFTGQMVASQGYCKQSTHKYRSMDSQLHPEDNEKVAVKRY